MDVSPMLVKSFDRLAPCLLIQFTDLRSSIFKEIASLINNCTEYLGPSFCSTAEKLVTSEG